MKAIEITSPGTVALIEREKPLPGRGEVLLRMKYVGFCGSDLSTYLGKNPLVQYPRIPGHEISAVVEANGIEVPDSIQPGQRVTVVPYTNCGICSSCRQKRYNACRYNQTLGVQRDGAFAEYIVLPWQKVLPVDGLSSTQLALVEPLTVGFHAIDNGLVTDSDTVLVLGSGMIGMGAIIRANLRGATVIAADIDDSKLRLAEKVGAQFTINTRTQNTHSRLEQLTGGNGPDVVVEAAGNPATYLSSVEEVAFSGRVVCIGYTNSEVTFPTKLWVQKEIRIFGSRNANPSDFEAVIKYFKQKTVDVSLLISDIIKPETAGDAMRKWAGNPGEILKILVEF